MFGPLVTPLANRVRDFEGMAPPLRTMSALPPRADIALHRSECPLCAKSGHMRCSKTGHVGMSDSRSSKTRTVIRTANAPSEKALTRLGGMNVSPTGPSNRPLDAVVPIASFLTSIRRRSRLTSSSRSSLSTLNALVQSPTFSSSPRRPARSHPANLPGRSGLP